MRDGRSSAADLLLIFGVDLIRVYLCLSAAHGFSLLSASIGGYKSRES